MTSAAFAQRIRTKPHDGWTWMRSSPAASSSREVLAASSVGQTDDAPLPAWLGCFTSRVAELTHLPDGWDSYGASALSPEVVSILFQLLQGYAFAIQSPPVISVNDEGGLVAEWETSLFSLDLLVNPGSEVCVYRHDV